VYDRLMEFYAQLAAGGAPSPLAYALIFAGGVMSGASPCYAPVLALFAGYVGGYARSARAGLAVAGPDAGGTVTGFGGVAPGGSFVAGNALSLAVFGAVAALAGGSVLALFTGYQLDRWIPGLVGLAMGLHLLGAVRLRLPEIPVPAALRAWRPQSPWGAFSIGVPFGVVVTPCAIPLFAAVVAFVAFQAGLAHGLLLMVAYALGRGLVLAAVAVSAGLLRTLDGSRAALTAKRAAGALLVAVRLGLLLFYDAWRDRIMPMPVAPATTGVGGAAHGGH
jgi:cytochrome c-type biogenesis protein